MSCLFAVATATPYGYYQGGYTNVVPAAYTYGSRSTYVQPAYSHHYMQPAYPAAVQPVRSDLRSVYTQPAYSQQYAYQPATYAKPTAFTAFSTPAASSANLFQQYKFPNFKAQTSSNNPFSYNKPLASDSKDLISAGVPRLIQAMTKLNELSVQLPTYLANADPQTKSDIVKVNGIVNDICARATSEINPTAYSGRYTPEGLKEMCDYITKVGNDIVAGLDNPAIFQKYTSDLQGAVTALNSNAADLVLSESILKNL